MFNQYFGQYLLHKNKITTEQLVEVMEYERSVRVKLGLLAINAGFMTADQVEKIHELQRVKDQRFGELAVAQGYLTYAQLEDLLDNQHCRHLGLSQVIADKGYLTLTELAELLASYKADTQFSSGQRENVIDFSVVGPQGEVYQEYIELLQRSIVRFLDETPVITLGASTVMSNHPWLIYQNIAGEVSLFTGLAMNDETLLAIARQYSGEALIEIDELAKDSVAEFLNMVNGIFCVNASNKGMELDLQLQKIVHNQLPALQNAYQVPIALSFGKIDVLLAAG